VGRRGKRLGLAFQHEFSRRQVVVRPGVEPEQLRIAQNLGQRRLVDATGVRHDLFQHIAHLEVMRVALIVVNIAAGERGAVQVPDEKLLVQRQRGKPVRIQLRDGGIVHTLE